MNINRFNRFIKNKNKYKNIFYFNNINNIYLNISSSSFYPFYFKYDIFKSFNLIKFNRSLFFSSNNNNNNNNLKSYDILIKQNRFEDASKKLKTYINKINAEYICSNEGLNDKIIERTLSIGDYENYMHRVSKAGKFGEPGVAVTLYDRDIDEKCLHMILNYFSMKEKVEDLKDAEQLKQVLEELRQAQD